MARTAMAFALLLIFLAAVQGQGIPSSQECQNRVNTVGQTGLLSQLSQCQGGPSQACCAQAQGLLGFPGSGQLAGCLCNPDVLEATLAGIEANALARNAGVTRASVQTVLDQCNVPTSARAGSCPAGGAPPTTVAVAAPGAQVGVTAPGAPPATPAPAQQAPAAAGPAPPTPFPAGPTPAPFAPAPAPQPAMGMGMFGGQQFAAAPAGGKGFFGHHGFGHKWRHWGRRLAQTTVGVTAPGTTVGVNAGGAPTPASAGPATAAAPMPMPAPAPAATGHPKGQAAAAVHSKLAAGYLAAQQAHQAKLNHVQSKLAAHQAAAAQAGAQAAALHQAAQQHKASYGRKLAQTTVGVTAPGTTVGVNTGGAPTPASAAPATAAAPIPTPAPVPAATGHHKGQVAAAVHSKLAAGYLAAQQAHQAKLNHVQSKLAAHQAAAAQAGAQAAALHQAAQQHKASYGRKLSQTTVGVTAPGTTVGVNAGGAPTPASAAPATAAAPMPMPAPAPAATGHHKGQLAAAVHSKMAALYLAAQQAHQAKLNHVQSKLAAHQAAAAQAGAAMQQHKASYGRK